MAEQKNKKSTMTNIYTKLLEFQKLNISVKKDANNPHFKSKYADLSEVISKIRPALTKVGITLIQQPVENGLNTILRDAESDSEIVGFLPFIGANDPQKLGSNLTYLRRYSLVTMLGLEDDDDDGNAATTKASPKAQSATQPINLEDAFKMLRMAETMEQLKKTFTSLSPALRKDIEVIAVKDEMKEKITTIN